MTFSSYTPATATIDPAAPGGIDALLAFHRATFGDARMEDDGGETSPGEDSAATGFPASTPVAEMTAEQQAAYWKHQSRRHEQRVKSLGDIDALRAKAARADELETERLSDAEKAAATARKEGEDAGRAAAQAATLPRLLAAEFRAAAAGRIPADKISGLIAPLNPEHFLTDGEVDTAKVQSYVDGIAPAGGKQWPDMGQGNRGTYSKADPREAGKAAAERRFGSKS